MSLEFHNRPPPALLLGADGLYRDGDWIVFEWLENPRRLCLFRTPPDDPEATEFRVDYYDIDLGLDANAEFEKASHGRKMGDWVRIASIPEPIVQAQQLDERLANGDLSRWLNDGDNAKFRTHRGKF